MSLNIKKLYQHTGKCDGQQQYKDIIEAAMVSTSERFTNNSPRSPTNQTPARKPNERKSLRLFTKILNVKQKTAIRRVKSAKSKLK